MRPNFGRSVSPLQIPKAVGPLSVESGLSDHRFDEAIGLPKNATLTEGFAAAHRLKQATPSLVSPSRASMFCITIQVNPLRERRCWICNPQERTASSTAAAFESWAATIMGRDGSLASH